MYHYMHVHVCAYTLPNLCMVISSYYDAAGTHSNGYLWLDLSLLRINFAGTIKTNYWELKCLN